MSTQSVRARSAGLAGLFSASLLAALAGTCGGAAINSQWVNLAGGNWGTAANWNPVAIPNNGVDTYDVAIDLAGPYVVTLDNDFTITSLNFSAAGSTLRAFSAGVGRTLTITGDYDQDDTTSLVGDDVGLVRQGTVDVSGTATFHGGALTYLNRFNSLGGLVMSTKSPIDINDTDVDHSGSNASSWSGSNDIRFNGNSSLTLGASSVFTITATGNISSTNPGSSSITNSGQVLFNPGAPNTVSINTSSVALVNNAAGTVDVQSGTLSTDGQFTNTGTLKVSAPAGKFRVTGAGNFTNFSGGTLSGGTLDLKGTLQFNGADIQNLAGSVTLDGASAKIVDQTGVTDGLRNAANVNAGGALLIKNGAAFTVGTTVPVFNVNTGGTFDVGTGSKLTIPAGKTFNANAGSTFANIASTTSGGEIVVQGTLRTPTSSITTVGSKITLDGTTADIRDVATNLSALGNLASISASGFLTVINRGAGNPLTTLAGGAAFNVATGGHLTIGTDVDFDIPNGLANLSGGSNATLDLGRFTLQGRIRTPLGGVTNLTLNNITTLDGIGSKIVEITDNSIDLFDKLTLIDTSGTLNLLNGRQINTTNLTVRGRLNVGGPVSGRPERGTPTSRITVTGDLVQESGFTGIGAAGRIVISDPDKHGYAYKVQRGTLGGHSTLEGLVELAGITGNTAAIAPGDEGPCNIGELTIQGGLRLREGSTFNVDMNSDANGIEALIDRLVVLNPMGNGPGSTQLDPGVVPLVNIHLCDGFAPVLDSVHLIADFGSISGTGFSYTGLTKPNGIEVAPEWVGGQLWMRVVAVPAPGTGVIGAALGMLSLRRRR